MEKIKTSDITELSEIRPMPKDQKEEEEVTSVAEMKSQKKANRLCGLLLTVRDRATI